MPVPEALATKCEAKAAIRDYIGAALSLGYVSPREYERQLFAACYVAA